jgi:hypothetical protein
VSLPPVALHDIADIEGFVRDTMRRHLSKVPHEDREELVAEGLVIICELAMRYDPAKDKPSRKPGHVCKTSRCCVPSFAGYASFLLKRKMLDAWHRMHPEHQLRTQDDGTRKYVYYPKPKSLDERSSDLGRDAHELPGTRQVGQFVPIEPEPA